MSCASCCSRPSGRRPEDVFLRALLELYGDELDDDAADRRPSRTRRARGVPARRLRASPPHPGPPRRRDLRRRRRHRQDRDRPCVHRGVRAAPGPALRSSSPRAARENWEQRIDAGPPARPGGLASRARRRRAARARTPRCAGAHLHNDKDAYRLVVVDEATRSATRTRPGTAAMERLLGGERKDVVLLTATPINNGLWDLYNLVMLFARHDRAFAADRYPLGRELFLAAGANERDPENLDPDCSSRSPTRSASAATGASSRSTTRAHVPRRHPGALPGAASRTRRYDLDDAHPGLSTRSLSADRRTRRWRGTGRAPTSSAAEEAAAEARSAGCSNRSPQALRVLLGGLPGDGRRG